jgi:NAD(P)-dependent dehydrogenase (short-subunit alcohol dehydrogenase family)
VRLNGRVAAITGAGSGIGAAIALAMAGKGARVAVTDLDLEQARRVAAQIESSGGEALALKLDVTRRPDAEQAVQVLTERWGRIDIWCNNAGVSTMAPFWDVTDQQWELNMGVNAKGVFICSQVVARRMMGQEPGEANRLSGKIINTASMAGRRGNAPFLTPYVASKFAVIGLTQAMAGELAPHGITVNAVCPGYVQTPMQERELAWEAGLRGTTPEEIQQLIIADTPLGRLQTPEDVANAVVFLSSADADYMTGQSLGVNGGAWME